MALKTGTRLGPYQITALLGAGGMGEVYSATDTRLNRTVAIKILPEHFSASPERRDRFQREARAISSLNHPKICTLYDVGEKEGLHYLVLEHLEGETLKERINRGPVLVAEALRLAAEIAEALDTAHRQDLIHRDLKPGNVMLTKSGIKLLDFGLARAFRVPPGDLSEAPTATSPVTAIGSILGTPQYMAPEQATGRQVDHRADQFALGVVLYEMLAGRRPFDGETTAETLSAILRDEPPPLARAAPHVPPPVRWIVERCLARDPGGRYDSTRDLARDLQTVRDRLSELAGAAIPSMDEPRRRRSPILLAAAVGGLLAVVLLLVFLGLQRSAEPPQLGYERITFRLGTVTGARFEPGGDGVLYSAAWDGAPSHLHLHRPGDLDPISIGPPGAELLSVSSQGETLLLTDVFPVGPFLRAGTLKRMPVTGSPRALAANIAGATFGSDGELAALVRKVEGGQTLVEFPVGTPRLTTRGIIIDLRLSPDGRRVAFVETSNRGRDQGPIVVLGREGDVIRFPHEGGAGLAWSPSGREVWFARPRGTSVHAIDLDGQERRVATFPAQVFLFDVSRDGQVLLGLEQVRFEAAGRAAGGEERPLTWLTWSVPFDISVGGDLVLFNECSGGLCRVALRTFGPEPPVVLGEGFGMSLSPAGDSVLSVPPWKQGEIRLIATGHAESRTIVAEGIETISFAAWLPDGQRILLNANLPGEDNRIFSLGLDGGTPVPLTPEGIGFGFFAVSPDGRFVAAPLTDGGIAIYPGEDGEQIYLDHDGQPIRWSADGRSLYTVPLAVAPAHLRRVEIASGTTQLVARLMPSDPAGVVQVGPVAVTPDGATYVYGYVRRLTVLFTVDGLK